MKMSASVRACVETKPATGLEARTVLEVLTRMQTRAESRAERIAKRRVKASVETNVGMDVRKM